MKLTIDRPEKICWFAIPVILLIGLITFNKTFDLQVHDTYFVTSNLHIEILFSLLLGLLGLGYWLVNKVKARLLKLLTWIHLVFTIGSIAVVLLLTILIDLLTEGSSEYFKLVNVSMKGALSAFILGQLIYLVNLPIGIFRR